MIRDMTSGSPAKVMVSFALPMILGNLFQQFYNIVDLIVVGNFVGASALAAVGASSTAAFLFVALSVGGAAGCTVVISQFFGAGKMAETKSAISTSLISMLTFGAVLSAAGVTFSGEVLTLMRTPNDIFPSAVSYFSIYSLALPFMFIYNGSTACFNALGDSRTPLYLLVATSLLNIALDMFFVIKLGLSVPGVAWATLISQTCAAFIALSILLTRLKRIKLDTKAPLFSPMLFTKIRQVSILSMVHQSIVSLGYIFVQALVNRYGTIFIAGYTAAIKIDNIAIQPMLNVGNALSAYTAQNTGAHKFSRISRGLKTAACLSSTIALTLTAIIFLWGRNLLGFFVAADSNVEVIEEGITYLHVVSAFYILMGLNNIFISTLRGSGDMNSVMLCAFINFGTRIAAAYSLAVFIGSAAIRLAPPIGWGVGLLFSITIYARGKWRAKSLV